MGARDNGSMFEGAGVAVEEVGLRVGVEQCMVLVLAVHSDQVATQLTQLTRVGVPPIDSCGTSLAKLSQQNQRRPTRLEKTLDRSSIGAETDLVWPAPCAERQPKGVHDERLAASGFTREQVESWAELNTGVRDQGQVTDPELDQHYFIGTRGRPQPSFSPRRL